MPGPTSASPFAQDLQAAVEAAYAVFGLGRVSSTLEVCMCPVCMVEADRAAIIATPVRDLDPELIRQYSNSAHGVPQNLADLRALLPRYLDLMAQEVSVDHVGVGVELSRFGDARRQSPDFLDGAQAAVLRDWARAMILHFGWCDVKSDSVESPANLFEALICGGWPVAEVTGPLEDLFRDTDVGLPALAAFAQVPAFDVGRSGDFLYALRYVPDAAVQEVADWLNSEALQLMFADALGGDTDDMAQAQIEAFVMAQGQFTVASFAREDKPA